MRTILCDMCISLALFYIFLFILLLFYCNFFLNAYFSIKNVCFVLYMQAYNKICNVTAIELRKCFFIVFFYVVSCFFFVILYVFTIFFFKAFFSYYSLLSLIRKYLIINLGCGKNLKFVFAQRSIFLHLLLLLLL